MGKRPRTARGRRHDLAAYDATDRSRVPLFVREGAILPMASSVRVWPGVQPTSFVVHDEDGQTTRIDAQASADGSSATVRFSRVVAASELRVRLPGGLHTLSIAASASPASFTLP